MLLFYINLTALKWIDISTSFFKSAFDRPISIEWYMASVKTRLFTRCRNSVLNALNIMAVQKPPAE